MGVQVAGGPQDEIQHELEVGAGERFEFGKNWNRFLSILDDKRIEAARASLLKNLALESLEGRSFLDIGSGSGLFSLAAADLGARVHSFDYDPQSVGCTRELKRKYRSDDSSWTIESGSALDETYLRSLGQHDVVYSWGVLHHTGDLWCAVELASQSVKPGGTFHIALYNDQGLRSRYWHAVKRTYNRNPSIRWLLIAAHAPTQFGVRWLKRALTGKLHLERGMSLWYDMIDWLGGYPFEVAKPSDVVAFAIAQGFEVLRVKTVGKRQGCNEFTFRRR